MPGIMIGPNGTSVPGTIRPFLCLRLSLPLSPSLSHSLSLFLSLSLALSLSFFNKGAPFGLSASAPCLSVSLSQTKCTDAKYLDIGFGKIDNR